MDMSKRAAVAISGLMFAGAAALTMSAAAPALAHTVKLPAGHSDDNGGGGGGGGGTIYNPYQPEKIFVDRL